MTFAIAGYMSLHGTLAVNQFFAFLAAMLLAQQPVRNLSQLQTVSTEGLAAANRIFAVIDAKPADRRPAGRQAAGDRPRAVRCASRTCRFRYNADAPALDSVSLDVAAGTEDRAGRTVRRGQDRRCSICCCASTTSTPARIAIDGQDIRDVTLSSLREQHRAGDAGTDPVRRNHRRQHRAWPPRRHARGDRGRGQGRRGA